MPLSRTCRSLPFSAVLLLAGACSTPLPAPNTATAARESMVWPAAPDEPRVRFERSVGGPRDLGIGTGALARFLAAVFGTREPRFLRPTSVAESGGVLYVADPDARTVWMLDPGRRRGLAGPSAGKVPLRAPVAVAAGADGGIYVADPELRKVFLFDRDGRFTRVAGEQGLVRPVGLAYDAVTQRLYVADAAADRILVFDARGAPVTAFGATGQEDGQFNHPTYVAVDAQGTVLVTDALNFRVQAFDREGRFLWKFGRHGDGSGDFASPKGVASDSAGHVYVVDALFGTVQLFDHTGNLLFGIGQHGEQSGQFWLPSGLYVNARGEIFVADSYNRRVQVFMAGAYARPEGL
jgi:DNA-binding beta-propeller fold protein YncE